MTTHRTAPIEGELLRLNEEIELVAREYGLDFFPVVFEICDYDTINILAAQGGFPSRYPHWRFGMDYDQMYKGYAYGMQKIYEMVVNTNPCYAYLLKSNNLVDQKIVMAHVFGHADFFKHNAWFKSTNKNMMDVMANHGTKIRRYMDKFGQDSVEEFIDIVLSIDNMLDVNEMFDKPERSKEKMEDKGETPEDERSFALKSFLRSKQRRDGVLSSKKRKESSEERNIGLPQKDIMGFLIEHAPLKEWQTDIIGMLREEAYYFLPQRMTKIINEGWASYWHSTIMTQKILRASEIIDFADHHAGVMAMSKKSINPYKIGIELFRDIEFRWNTGRYGKNYNDCTDMSKKSLWDTGEMNGRKKIFEVRETHNDLTFIDEFFTREFCERQQLFTYNFNPRTGRNEIENREFLEIKNMLLKQLTNFGTPVIEVIDENFANRSELHLKHTHHGDDLDINFAQATLTNLYKIWKRPVNLSTSYEEKEVTYCFDGSEFKELGQEKK